MDKLDFIIYDASLPYADGGKLISPDRMRTFNRFSVQSKAGGSYRCTMHVIVYR